MHRRPGFTLFEMLVVCAVLLMLGAAIMPIINGFWADGRTRAAVDISTSRLADARSYAVAHSRNYQFLTSPDGKQVKVAADPSETPEAAESGAQNTEFGITITLPSTVTLTPGAIVNNSGTTPPTDGWVVLATYKPDGTCVEDSSEFTISEPGVIPVVIRVRGLTGTVIAANENAAAPTAPTRSP